MSRCEDIDNAIWDDPEFQSLSANATLLYIWSFTNPRCDWSGMYKVSHRSIAAECKVPESDIPATLTELATGDFAFYEANVLWVRARVKRLRSRSPQMAKAVIKDLQRVDPKHPLRRRWMTMYASDPWLRDALKDTYREGNDRVSETPVSKPDPHTLSAPYREGAGKGEGEGVTTNVELPEDFPRELEPHLRTVFKVLRDLARRHNAKAISPLSLAAVVMGRPHKPLVAAAYDFAGWADGQAVQRKDVLSGYRNWLEKTNDLAGFERLGPNGLPSGNSGSVRPLRGENAGSMLQEIWPDQPPDAESVPDADVVEEGEAA